MAGAAQAARAKGERGPPRTDVRVLSMGGGVNSVALLLRHPDWYTHCVFADTGAERPPTYAYLREHVEPFCRERGIAYAVVRHRSGRTLEEHSRAKRMIPIRHLKWCTNEFKKQPINRWVRRTFDAHRSAPIRLDIAIARDEAHRARFSGPGDRPLYVQREYPLVDEGIGREACLAIIRQARWPAPEKSGCYFCFNRPLREFHAMADADPERLAQIIALEEQGSDFPATTFKGQPMRQIAARPLDAFLGLGRDDEEAEVACEDGYCMR